MEFRGPILIATALSLIASAAVVMQANNEAAPDPTMVETVAGARAGCAARGLDTPFGRLGCDISANSSSSWTRRTTSGGAVFISSSGR